MFEHREARGWRDLLLMGLGVAACLVGIAHTGLIGALFLIVPAGVLCTSIAMLGHEGSHRSFSASPWRNALLVYLVSPLFSGLGRLYWQHKHDRLHHGHPNVEGIDPDIKPFPFVSSRADHERAGRFTRWFQRNCQRWLFWPMSTLMAIGMRRSSILYLAHYPKKSERQWWLEVACMLGHYTGWLVIPSIVWGPLVGIGLYVAIWGVTGVCLALIFAPAHMGLPVVTEQAHDWVHQLETTRNLELPRVVSFFFMGLDYQVEHHLFPKIPRQNLPEAARITSAWCRKNGIVYHSMPYPAALLDAARFISNAWARDALQSLREREANLVATLQV